MKLSKFATIRAKKKVRAIKCTIPSTHKLYPLPALAIKPISLLVTNPLNL
jgi:hypothetical protein